MIKPCITICNNINALPRSGFGVIRGLGVCGSGRSVIGLGVVNGSVLGGSVIRMVVSFGSTNEDTSHKNKHTKST